MSAKVKNLQKTKMFDLPDEKEKEEIKKEVKSRFDGRWVILILLVLTILASLFFYLRAELPNLYEKIFSSEVVLYKPPE